MSGTITIPQANPGAGYRALKAKYDAAGNAQTLYKKVVLAPT